MKIQVRKSLSMSKWTFFTWNEKIEMKRIIESFSWFSNLPSLLNVPAWDRLRLGFDPIAAGGLETAVIDNKRSALSSDHALSPSPREKNMLLWVCEAANLLRRMTTSLGRASDERTLKTALVYTQQIRCGWNWLCGPAPIHIGLHGKLAAGNALQSFFLLSRYLFTAFTSISSTSHSQRCSFVL